MPIVIYYLLSEEDVHHIDGVIKYVIVYEKN